MSKGELRKHAVINGANAGFYTVKEAAKILNLSTRQIKRLKKGVKEKGPKALIHGNRGRVPAHAIPEAVKEEVYALACSPDYQGVNFSHFRDLLQERENLNLSVGLVSKILKAKGIQSPKKRRRAKHFRSRPRKEQEGMMALVDASPHDWLEARGPKMNLHALIDDATSKVLGAFFRPEEDLIGYFQVFQQMVSKYGVPLSIYSDRHSIFLSPNHAKLSMEEELEGVELRLTQLGRALAELGTAHIKALTPQAKGRVERLFGTLQDRLRIEMRLNKISCIKEANAFLPRFIEKYNRKFVVKAQGDALAYQVAPTAKQLRHILCCKVMRQSSKGSSLSIFGKTYQLIQADGRVLGIPAHKTVTVHQMWDGSLYGEFKGVIYGLQELVKAERSEPEENYIFKPDGRKNNKPVTNSSPWRRMVINPKTSQTIRDKAPAKI